MNKHLSNTLIDPATAMDRRPHTLANIDQSERVLSLFGGSILLYKSLKQLGKHPIVALQGAAAGGLLIYRGATGVCPLYTRLGIDTTDPQAINISEKVTVNVNREKVYAFWRELSNLPKFMSHLKQVTETSPTQSHWTANTPGQLIDLDWHAEITHEEPGRYIGWQSTKDAMIQNAGKVTFSNALNQIDTEIHVEISYFPPAGSVGRGLTSLFNGVFEKMIRQDILDFKTYVEELDFRTYIGLSTEKAG